MLPDESLGSRQKRTSGLALVVVGIWLGLLFSPILRPIAMIFLGWTLGGGLVVALGVALGRLGFGLTRGFWEPRPPSTSDSQWPELSDEIPAVKPSGPARWTRVALPGLIGFLLLVFFLALTGDPWGLQRLIFGGLMLSFGVVVVLTLLAGSTLALARAIRGLTRRIASLGEGSEAWPG